MVVLRHWWKAAAAIVLFVVMAVFLGNWPVKNIYHGADQGIVMAFSPETHINPAKFIIPGHSDESHMSLPHLLLVRAINRVIEDRLEASRLSSVLVSVLALLLLYRIASLAFTRQAGVLTLLLAATSPMMIETLRAHGFVPLSGMVVLAVVYLAARLGESPRLLSWGTALRLLLLITLSASLWSLHVVARAAVGIPPLVFLLTARRRPVNLLKLLIYLAGLVGLLLLIYRAGSPELGTVKNLLLVSPEWYSEEQVGPVLLERLRENIPWGVRYLTNAYRPPPAHSTHPIRARFYSLLYTPFFFVGLISLLRRWRGHAGRIALISSLAVLYLLPLGSSGAHLRRMVYALYPIYVVLAHGLLASHQWYRRTVGRRLPAGLAAGLPLLFMLGAIGSDLYAYEFEISVPLYNEYTTQQLREFTQMLLLHGGRVGLILFTKGRDMENLLYGNPLLVNRDEVFELLPRLRGIADPGALARDRGLYTDQPDLWAMAIRHGLLLINRVSGSQEAAHEHEHEFARRYRLWYPRTFWHAVIPNTDICYSFLPGPGPDAIWWVQPTATKGTSQSGERAVAPRSSAGEARAPEEARR